MKTLDRYIIRQFLVNFFILLLVFMALFIVVDLIVDLDEFIEAGRLHAHRWGGVLPAILATIADYYGPVALLLYVFFSGLIAVAAMGFTFAHLARAGELVAMVTSGISMFRIAGPIVLASVLLNALTLPNQEWVIPHLAAKLARSKSQVRFRTISAFEVRFAPDNQGNLLSAARFEVDSAPPMLVGVTILIRDPQGQALKRITAEQAFWDAHRRGWELVGSATITASLDHRPLDIPPQAPSTQIDFFPTDLSPDALLARQATIYPMLLSLAQLKNLAASSSINAPKMLQIMHSRLSLLVVNVLVLVMALPFFLNRQPVNMLLQAVKAAGLCLTVWSAGLVVTQAGLPMLNPVASAWLPVVLYLPLAAWLLQTIKS